MTAEHTANREVSRREFFQWGVWIIGGVFSVLLGIPIIGYFLSSLFHRQTPQWVQVCTLDQINFETPTEFQVTFQGEAAHRTWDDVRGVFVIRKGDDVLAFTNVCTHMGCSVRWLDWRQQILCPCHGGVYDRWGNLAGGPPAHSLPFYDSKIEDNVLYVANRMKERW